MPNAKLLHQFFMAVKRYWPNTVRKHSFKITEKRLRGLGVCHSDGSIDIDPRQKPLVFLETLVHELLHRQFPMLSEEAVEANSLEMAESLWQLGYRRTLQ